MENKTFKWTSEQLAIHHTFATGKAHTIVEARAGSSKTTTVTVGLNLAPETNCLYLVFNKKLQVEATGKITNRNVDVRTHHSVGNGFILKNWGYCKAGAATEYFRIKDIAPDMPSQAMFRTAQLVSYLKNTTINPTLDDAMKAADLRGIDAGKDDAAWPVKTLAEIALKSMEKSKIKSNYISFDDMVWLPLVMGWVKPTFDLIVVDEAQDMSMPQLEMIMRLIKAGGRIIIVGDRNQAIYGFRGAMSNGMTQFQEKLNAKSLPLTISFRNPKKVIRLAQSFVPDIREMDGAIEGEVNNLNEDSYLKAIKVKDVILSRTNAPLMKQCLSLIRKRTPAYIEGRDFAKILIDLIDDIGGKNIIEFLDRLQTWQNVQVAKATTAFAMSKLDIVADKAETLRVLSESCLTIEDMKKRIDSIFFDADKVKAPSVILSTVHKAKGLEWDNVFILSDSFKTRRGATQEELQEERNIYYVAVTRARKSLSLVRLDNGGGAVAATQASASQPTQASAKQVAV